MEERTKTSGLSFQMILSFIAFIGIGCIALALILKLIFKGNVSVANVFSAVGQVIAYLICIFSAYHWVRTHKQTVWIVLYVIFVVVIVVLFILTV